MQGALKIVPRPSQLGIVSGLWEILTGFHVSVNIKAGHEGLK